MYKEGAGKVFITSSLSIGTNDGNVKLEEKLITINNTTKKAGYL